MNLGHTIGIASGALAAAVAAFLAAAPNLLPETTRQAAAGLVAALAMGSVYLLHAYPVEAVPVATSPPEQTPP